MSDVHQFLDGLGRLAQRPPAAPRSITQIATRSRARRQRRRAVGLGTAVLIVLLSTVVIVKTRPAPTNELHTIDQPTIGSTLVPTISVPAPPSTSGVRRGMTVVPDADLEDGQIVEVRPDAGVTGMIGQCAIEVLDAPDLGHCRQDFPPIPQRFSVSRMIVTVHGVVDCAERPRRCVIGIGNSLVPSENAYAAISFRSGLPPMPATTLTVDTSRAVDGGSVIVSGTGFRPGEQVLLAQCPDRDVSLDLGAMPVCDVARGPTRVVSDHEGRFRAPVIVFRDILSMTANGWEPCSPCVVRASSTNRPVATARITMTGSGPSQRPVVTIREAGPYRLGQAITLDGRGFQPGSRVLISVCDVSDPSAYPRCSYPSDLNPSIVDETGRFVREGYAVRASYCLPPGQCKLMWLPGEGTPAVFEVPIQIMG